MTVAANKARQEIARTPGHRQSDASMSRVEKVAEV